MEPIEHVRTPKFKKMEKKYAEQMSQLGVLITPFNPKIGLPIVAHAEMLADVNIGYAEVDPNFCKALEKVLNATPLFAMIGGYATLVGAILSAYGRNPMENILKAQMEKMNGKTNLSGLS